VGDRLGWRYAFFIPALTLLAIWGLFLILQRNRPEDVGLPPVEVYHNENPDVPLAEEAAHPPPEGSWKVILDVLRTQDNTVIFVTHDVSEAVYLADVIFVLSHRPARVLHRIEVPYFANREAAVKQSAEFKLIENNVLELLHTSNVHGNIRVGL